MQLFLPSLRADLAMLETYVYTTEKPLDFSISAFGGLQDSTVSKDDLAEWREQTLLDCQILAVLSLEKL